MKESHIRENTILRVRRAALGAIIAGGGLPRPGQFVRAGLPPMFRASEWILAAATHESDCERFGVAPDQRTTPDGLAWRETQIARCREIDAEKVAAARVARLAEARQIKSVTS